MAKINYSQFAVIDGDNTVWGVGPSEPAAWGDAASWARANGEDPGPLESELDLIAATPAAVEMISVEGFDRDRYEIINDSNVTGCTWSVLMTTTEARAAGLVD